MSTDALVLSGSKGRGGRGGRGKEGKGREGGLGIASRCQVVFGAFKRSTFGNYTPQQDLMSCCVCV